MRRLPTASCRADHPRVCGEHLATVYNRVYSNGSPPRLRGARTGTHTGINRRGITPAFAGSTGARYDWTAASPDHPRVCGEHAAGSDHAGNSTGSPPRLRGALYPVATERATCRITPAFAGSTLAAAPACGSACGSPPRLRGARAVCQHFLGGSRITPAFAGSTITHSSQPRRTQDHPRVCGEHTRWANWFGGVDEDHPRVCGEH